MRILILAPTVGLGEATGDAVHLAEEVAILERRGWQILLLVGNAREGERTHPKVTVMSTGFHRDYDSAADLLRYLFCMLRGVPRLLQGTRAFRPEIVYQRHVFMDFGSVISRLLGVPLVTELNGLAFLERPMLDRTSRFPVRLVRFLERLSLRSHDGYVSVTSELAAFARDEISIKAGTPVVVTGNGVNTESFVPGDISPSELALPEGVYVVFVGHLVEWQCLGLLLDSMVQVVRSVPSARLVIIGDGPERKNLEIRARRNGLQNCVVFTGRAKHSEVPKLIQVARVCVVLSSASRASVVGEAPIKAYEYMASGKPIVTNGLGALSAIIKNQALGDVVANADGEELSGALLKFLTDSRLARETGQRARDWVVQNQSWEIIVDKIEDLLNEVLARRRGN